MTCHLKALLGLLTALTVLIPATVQAQEGATGDEAAPRPDSLAQSRLSAFAVPKTVAATWSLNAQDFNFRSNSMGYGVAYELALNSRISLSVDYTHAELKLDADSVGSGLATRYFQAGTVAYDTYFARFQYCFSGSSNFFQQICPGLDVGGDAYPILSFTRADRLKLDRLQDAVIGPKVTYLSPISDRILFHATGGYNYGTGIGGSKTVKSKGNSSYYLKIGAGGAFNARHGMDVDVFWQNRNAKAADKTATVTDERTTKSTELGVRIAYTYRLQ